MKRLSAVLSLLLITTMLVAVLWKHQHAGLYEETQARDMTLWLFYAFFHLLGFLEIVLASIRRDKPNARLLAALYFGSLVLWLALLIKAFWQITVFGYFSTLPSNMMIWPDLWPLFVLTMSQLVFFVFPQFLLVYLWCIKPFLGTPENAATPRVA